MTSNLIRLTPPQQSGTANPSKWVGRIVIFELTTGTRIQGKIIAVSEDWIDTDNGAVKVEHIVHAKWVGAEEAAIIRGGPLGQYERQLR